MIEPLTGRFVEERPSGDAQRTLKQEIRVRGRGLHTGVACAATVVPAAVSTGIVFASSDGSFTVRPEAVVGVERCTSLGDGAWSVSTVEHLLAALHGLRVDNARVIVEGPELPALDGSALPWANAILEVGLRDQDAEASALKVTRPAAARVGQSCAVALPADVLEVTAVIEYEHPMLGTQAGSFRVEPEGFVRDVAPARTYGFASELEGLARRGLARGGSLDNAVVIYDDHYSDTLRFPDECLRHKVLDIIGDLYTIGRRIVGHIVAFRPGHPITCRLVRTLCGLYEPQLKLGPEPV